MLRIVFDESLDTAFGQSLPVPYIERIYVKSSQTNAYDDTVDGIEVEMSVYLPASDSEHKQPPHDLKNALGRLNVYVAYVIGEQENNHILNSEKNIFNYLYNYDPSTESGWELVSEFFRESAKIGTSEPDASGNEFISNRRNYEQLSFDDFELVDDEGIYDETTTQRYFVYKTTTTLKLAIASWSEIYTFDDLMDVTSSDYKKINVYSFCSPINWLEIQSESAGYDESEIQNYYLGKPELLNFITGDYTHEIVFDDGTLTDGEELSFIDSDNALYSDTPIYTTAGEYRDFVTRGEFVANIEAIASTVLGGEDDDPVESSAAQSAIAQSLTAIVDNYKNSVNLLKELNDYRRVFPDKSLAVYSTFRENLLAANKQAARGTRVFKVVSRSPKIIDSRIATAEVYEVPDPSPSTTDGSTINDYRIYNSTRDALITRYAYSSVITEGEESTFAWDSEDTICDYGYLWFDYEKAIRNDTVIASVFDIDKLEYFFGSALVNATLKLTQATLTKRIATDSILREVRQMTATLNSSQSNEKFNTYQCRLYSDHDSTTSSSWPEYNYDKVDVGMDGSEDYSYLCIRNIIGMPSAAKESDADVRNGYRMLCFYFQDYYDFSAAGDGTVFPSSEGGSTEYSQENYTLSIKCEDYSYLVYNTLADNFQAALRKLAEYSSYAEDTGNYNDYTGFFNQFFIDGVSEFYSEDPDNAPWLLAPMVFNIHRDLLLNTFEGDFDAVVEDSQKLSTNIAPESGNLEQLQVFIERMRDFYTEYYVPGTTTDAGTVFSVFANAYSEAFGYVADEPIEKTYYQEFPILPDIIYAGETYEDYVDDIETTAAYPVATSEWSAYGIPGDPDYDTSTLYSKEEIRSQIQSALIYITEFIDYLDTISTSDALFAREQLEYLLDPSLSSTYYQYATQGLGFAATLDPGGEGDFFKWLLSESTTASTLSLSSFTLINILEYIGHRVWSAANYSETEFGTSPQIIDFYDLLSVDDDYRP